MAGQERLRFGACFPGAQNKGENAGTKPLDRALQDLEYGSNRARPWVKKPTQAGNTRSLQLATGNGYVVQPAVERTTI